MGFDVNIEDSHSPEHQKIALIIRSYRGRRTLVEIIRDQGFDPANRSVYNKYNYVRRIYNLSVSDRRMLDPEERTAARAERIKQERKNKKMRKIWEAIILPEIMAAKAEMATAKPFKKGALEY